MSKIRSPLASAAEQFPNSPAVISSSRMLNYEDLASLVHQMMNNLSGQGIKKNDRVALVGRNSVENIISLWALWHIGCTAVLLSTRYTEEQSKDLLNEFRIDKTIESDIKNFEVDLKQTDLPAIDLDCHATVLFTSGTTNQPKAVVHSFGNHYDSTLGSNENIKLDAGDRWLLSLPIYHVGGLAVLFRCALSASAVVIDECDSLVDSIEQNMITHLSVVSSQLSQIIDNIKSNSIASLKAVLLGGGHTEYTFINNAMQLKLPLYTTYGLTEMGSQVTTTPPGSSLDLLLTSGKALKYRQVKISDDGEILVKGEVLFKSYLNLDNNNIDQDGWFHTGDLGKFDANGNLIVSGRKDNMFISGGENIYPEEIESALMQLDNIEEAVVVPIQDEKFGHRPIAFILYKDSFIKKTDLSLLNLEKFKIPDKFITYPNDYKKSGIKPDRSYFKSIAKKL